MSGRVYYPTARAILQVVFDGFGTEDDDTDPFIIPVLPREVSIQRNSYQQADSWEMTFDANDLPIDPQLVRAGAAEIYVFGMPGIRDDQRVLNRSQSFENSANRKPRDGLDDLLLDINQRAAVDRFVADHKPSIVGLFDDHSLELSRDGRWVTISGQDYTDFLIKKQWKPMPNGRARRVPTGRRLDVILRSLLAEADEEGRLSLKLEGVSESELPVVGANEAKGNARGIPVEQDTSYWDVMYKLATRHGAILFVRGLDVVLARPGNIDAAYNRRVRHLVWGHNVEDVELRRHLGKESVPTVVIKATNPKTRETIVVDYPPGHWAKVKKRGGGTTKTGKQRKISIKKSEEYAIYPVWGITDVEVLRKAAEARYHLLGRG